VERGVPLGPWRGEAEIARWGEMGKIDKGAVRAAEGGLTTNLDGKFLDTDLR